MSANSEFQLCSLIVHWVARIDSYHSAFGIHAIKCSLRTSNNVYSVYKIVMTIKHSLAHKWHTIRINTYGWAVYTRADTSYIYR